MPVLTNAAEEVLVHLIRSDESVRSMIADRVCPDQAPLTWKNYTCIVYEQQSDKRQRTLSGESGLVHARFSIYCIDRNRAKSRLLAKLVRAAIAVDTRTTIVDVDVKQVYVVDGERDESLPGADGLDAPERYRTLDCVIHHQAT